MNLYSANKIGTWFRDGTDLLRRTVPIAIATAFVIILEPFLPRSDFKAVWSESGWQIIINAVHSMTIDVVCAALVLTLLRALVSCWFTDVAMTLRNKKFDGRKNLFNYILLFLSTEVTLYTFFGCIGLATVWLSFIFFPNSLLNKLIPAMIIAILWPVFTTTINFNLYVTWFSRSYQKSIQLVSALVKKYAIKVYVFFLLTSFVSILFGFMIPVLILRSGLNVYFRYIFVAAILAVTLSWLRAVGFEFKNSILWNEIRRDPRITA